MITVNSKVFNFYQNVHTRAVDDELLSVKINNIPQYSRTGCIAGEPFAYIQVPVICIKICL